MLNVLRNLSHNTVNSWFLSTFSEHAVCPVQIVRRILKRHISQNAAECPLEAHIETCAEEVDDHHYVLDSLFWHAGGAEW